MPTSLRSTHNHGTAVNGKPEQHLDVQGFKHNEEHIERIEKGEAEAAVIPSHGLDFTPEEKKLHRRVNLKMDLYVLPTLSVLYLMSGLDRANVGNAQTVNFAADIGIRPEAVNNSVSLFFVTFVTLQPLSAAIGKAVGAKYWIPFLMLGWGVSTLAHAFVKNEAELIVCRLLVGVFEAGFYPTAVYYLSACYIRYDLALRVALFYGTYAIAGAFGSIIAYGLLQVNSPRLHSWQILFIFEGALTVGIGAFALFWIPKHLSTAWFLTPEEKNWAKVRMERDYGGEDASKTGITKRDFIEAVKDWKFWTVLPANITSSVPGQAFSVFLPLVVRDLGYSSYRANLFSVPIYVVGAVGLWIFAFSSDHFRERSWHILTALVFVIVGFIAVGQVKSASGKYAALCVMQIGTYAASPLTVAWLANNTPRPGTRALVLGFNGWGNLSGVIGAQLFRPQYAPSYTLPFFVCLGLNIYAFINYIGYRYLLIYVNGRRAKKLERMTQEEVERELVDDVRVGDKKRTFRYTT